MLSTRASISAKTLATAAASVGIMLPSESNEAICIGHANKCNRKQSKREMQTGNKANGKCKREQSKREQSKREMQTENKANGTSPLPPFTRGRLTLSPLGCSHPLCPLRGGDLLYPLCEGETYFYLPLGVHIHSPPCEGGRGMFHRICKQKQNGNKSKRKQKQTKHPPTPLHKGESGCVKFVLW